MIRLVLAVVLTASMLAGASAESVTPPDLSPPDSWTPRPAGTLRVLNKIDGTMQTVTVRAGQTVQLAAVSITLRACAVRPPDLPADAAARLLITGRDRAAALFDGWILQNEPAANMLEDPVFDVQLAGCG